MPFLKAFKLDWASAVLACPEDNNSGSRSRGHLVGPQFLILDEATSNLDSIAEHAIQRAMATFGRDRTMVVIAHRLATIKRADNILVLDEGRVIEQGRHDELLKARGRYWEMIEHQRLDIIDVEDQLTSRH